MERRCLRPAVERGDDLVHRIVHDYPAIRVITCSSGTPTMRIFPSFHRGESYLRPLEPAVFTEKVYVRGIGEVREADVAGGDEHLELASVSP